MRRFEFLDPAIVLERKQDETCLGCAALQLSRWGGARKYVCSNGFQKASTEWSAMRRCRKFEAEDQ